MSLATDILRSAGLKPPKKEYSPSTSIRHTSEPTPPVGYIDTPHGRVRLNSKGKPDGRSLKRGVPKPNPQKGKHHSWEIIQLRKAFESADAGDEFAWDWRTKETYLDIKARNRQTQYAYKAAEIFGYRISISSQPGYMRITVLGRSDKS